MAAFSFRENLGFRLILSSKLAFNVGYRTQAQYARGGFMSDLQVILFFLAMPLMPCLVASIMARNKRIARAKLAGGDAVPTYELDEESEVPRTPVVDRRALAEQRNWERYYKSTGQVPPTGDRRIANRRREANPAYRERRRG